MSNGPVPHRALPVISAPAAPGASLADAGWTRRCDATPPRLQELAELYEALGFAVRLEPIARPAGGTDCDACCAADDTRTIYTREAR